jgi:hypothetical protein
MILYRFNPARMQEKLIVNQLASNFLWEKLFLKR